MIVSINPNPALDHVLFVDDLASRGTIRASRSKSCIGGKGADVAFVLSQLGVACRLVSFTAGKYGHVLEELYKKAAIPTDLLEVAGEVRVVTNIIEEKTHALTQISQEGFSLREADFLAFMKKIEENVSEGEWAVAAGSLPKGMPGDFYSQLIEMCHGAGAKILLDIHGEPLWKAIGSNPDFIKMNLEEFSETFRLKSMDKQAVIEKAREQLQTYKLNGIMVTLGAAGILLIGPDEVLQAKSPRVEVVNSAGAGDAVSAAFTQYINQGSSWAEALQWAAAIGASVVGTETTAECNQELAAALLPDVQVYHLSFSGEMIDSLFG